MNQMPKINYVAQTEKEDAIMSLILNHGKLRASKPPVPKMDVVNGVDGYKHFLHLTPENDTKGDASYVWRMVAFMVSPKSQHHCMPMTADFCVSGNIVTRRNKVAVLDKLVDRIVDCVPKEGWPGIHRWAGIF